jgi:hypothetical protein
MALTYAENARRLLKSVGLNATERGVQLARRAREKTVSEVCRMLDGLCDDDLATVRGIVMSLSCEVKMKGQGDGHG